MTPRKKKTPVQKKKEKLWELCKEVVRKRDGNVCVICGASGLIGSNWHTGHLIPSSVCGAHLRYDLRNLHSNCYKCNVQCGGNGAMYYRALERKYGKTFVEKIFLEKNKSIKADILFYEDKIYEFESYKTMTKRQLLTITKGL